MWREGWRGMGRGKEGDKGLSVRKVSSATRPDWNRIPEYKTYTSSYSWMGYGLMVFRCTPHLVELKHLQTLNRLSYPPKADLALPQPCNNIEQHVILNIFDWKADILAFTSWWWKGIKMSEGNKGTFRNIEVRHILLPNVYVFFWRWDN